MFREYVENIWEISEALALKRFEKQLRNMNTFT